MNGSEIHFLCFLDVFQVVNFISNVRLPDHARASEPVLQSFLKRMLQQVRFFLSVLNQQCQEAKDRLFLFDQILKRPFEPEATRFEWTILGLLQVRAYPRFAARSPASDRWGRPPSVESGRQVEVRQGVEILHFHRVVRMQDIVLLLPLHDQLARHYYQLG